MRLSARVERSRRHPVARLTVGRVLICCLAGFGLCPAWGRETPDFRSQVDLPAPGVRIALPSTAEAKPLGPLRRYAYQLRQGDRKWTEDRYDPHAVWYRTQHAGQWQDQAGNRIVLAQVPRDLRAGFDGPHVTMGDIDARFSRMPDLSAAGPEALVAWAHAFLGVAPGAPEILRFLSGRIRLALFVPTGDRTLDVLSPTGRHRRRGAEADTAMAGGAGAAMRRSREGARRSIAHLQDWWHHDTPHSLILSNQRGDNDGFIRELEHNLEIMRGAYRALMPPLAHLQRVSIIRLFDTPEAYGRYVGPALP